MSDEPKTYTQDEVNSIVKSELAKFRNEQEARIANYEATKAKVDELKSSLESGRPSPELIEARRQAEESRARLQALKRERADLKDQERQYDIKDAFMREAQRAGLVFADDAFKLTDLSNVEVENDGTVSGIEDVIEELIRNKPYLWANGKPPRILSVDELEVRARKTGKIRDKLSAIRARYLGRLSARNWRGR